MGARRSCCLFNLAKLNPSNGQVYWRALIEGDGSFFSQASCFIRQIEPLHGTNDIILSVGDGLGSSAICRVDNTGAQVWYYNISLDYRDDFRMFGCDGTYIVCMTSSGLIGLDYSGSLAWTQSATGLKSIVVGVGAVVAAFCSTTPRNRVYDPTSGALIFSASAPTSGVAYAADQSTGFFLATGASGTNLTVYDPTFTVQILNGNRSNANKARINSSEYPKIAFVRSGEIWYVDFSGSPFSSIWNKSAIAGASTSLNMADCDYDSAGVYCASFNRQNITEEFNIFKYDTSGSFVWGSCPFGVDSIYYSGIYGCTSVCLSNEGKLYAGGNPGKGVR